MIYSKHFKIGDVVKYFGKHQTKGIVVGFSKIKKFAIVNWLEGEMNNGNYSPDRLQYYLPPDLEKVCKKRRRK